MKPNPYFLGAAVACAFLSLLRLARAPQPGADFDPGWHASHVVYPESLTADVAALSSPDFLGRSEQGPGAARAADWIEKRFARIGLNPVKTTFAVRLRGRKSGQFSCGGAAVADADWKPLTWSGEGDVEAPLALGMAARITGDMARLKGKIAVESIDPAPGLFRQLDPPLHDRVLAYQEAGALGVVFVAPQADPEAGGEAAWPGKEKDWKSVRKAIGEQARAMPRRELRIPAVLAAPSAARAVLGAGSARIAVAFEEKSWQGWNVSAVLPGAESPLDERLLAVTAHYDSHGIDDKGTLYPGACDNATGVASLFALAQAFKSAPRPPRRGILFVAFGGEELGLLGSRAFASQDVRVPGRILACINLDMLGRDGSKLRPGASPLFIIGAGASPRLAELLTIGLSCENLVPGTGIDFAFPHGSDHWPLHRAGVPSVTLTCSRFPEKDLPADTPDLVDAEIHRSATIGVFATAWWLANSQESVPSPRDVWVPFPGERK